MKIKLKASLLAQPKKVRIGLAVEAAKAAGDTFIATDKGFNGALV